MTYSQTSAIAVMEKSRYFKPEEFMCRCGCGQIIIDDKLIEKLDKAREAAGVSFTITSGYRCEKHNANVGGVKDSAHIKGMATDIACPDSRTMFLIVSACLNHFDRLGINFSKKFIHVDVDPAKDKKVLFSY